MWRSTSPSSSALLLAAILLAAPAASQPAPTNEAVPQTESECRAWATQKANEEYLAQDNSLRRNSPFQSGPAGTRDPFTDSQRQQLGIERSARERQLLESCIERLKRQR